MSKGFAHYFNRFLVVLILASVLYWVAITALSPENAIYFDAFGFILALVPFAGALLGFSVQKQWGGFGSFVGRSIIFISGGLLMWSFGQLAYLYYAVTAGEVPYPGLPDFFFVLMDPFYVLAILMIMKYAGVGRKIKTSSFAQFLLLVVPLATLALNLKTFFGDFSNIDLSEYVYLDFVYTFGSIAVMTLIVLTILLSAKNLGGKMGLAVYMFLLGIVFQYVGDWLYSYFESREIFVENGSVVDFVFFLSVACVAYGLGRFNTESLNGSTEPV